MSFVTSTRRVGVQTDAEDADGPVSSYRRMRIRSDKLRQRVRRYVADRDVTSARIIPAGEGTGAMVLVIALPDLALQLSHFLVGARYVVRVEDGKDLRHRVHSYQPDIAILDWRIGGSAWRALDEVTAIVERTSTHPYVIALLPKVSKRIKVEAAKAGCYDVVNVSASDCVRQVVEAVGVAQRARAARQLEARRVSRANLH